MFRLYPRLDPSAYYLIPESCVIGSKSLDDAERVELLVTWDCEIQQVSRDFLSVADLRGDDLRRKGGCSSGCGRGCGGCGGCGGGGTPWGEVVYYYRDRADRIRFLMTWARMWKDFGLEQLECMQVTSMTAACCSAVNDLLKNPVYAEADKALCICGGDCGD